MHPNPTTTGTAATAHALYSHLLLLTHAQAHSSVPFVPGTHPELRVGHFTIYGGAYYSYIYARYISSALWNKYLVEDPLDARAGGVGGAGTVECTD